MADSAQVTQLKSKLNSLKTNLGHIGIYQSVLTGPGQKPLDDAPAQTVDFIIQLFTVIRSFAPEITAPPPTLRNAAALNVYLIGVRTIFLQQISELETAIAKLGTAQELEAAQASSSKAPPSFLAPFGPSPAPPTATIPKPSTTQPPASPSPAPPAPTTLKPPTTEPPAKVDIISANPFFSGLRVVGKSQKHPLPFLILGILCLAAGILLLTRPFPNKVPIRPEYESQLQSLDKTKDSIQALIGFIDDQKKQLQLSQNAVEALKTEESKIHPLVEADRKVIDDIFAVQEQRNQKDQTKERWIGFGIGVMASLLASMLASLVYYVVVGRLRKKQNANPK